MSHSSDTEVHQNVYLLDAYHTGIRMVVLLSMVVGAVIGSLLLPQIIAWLRLPIYPIWAGLVGSLVLLIAFGSIAENIARKYWPSRKQVIVADNTLSLVNRNQQPIQLSRTDPISRTRWYFVIPRKRGTVEKGSYCTAVHLTQEDRFIVLYAFMSPDQASQLPDWSTFEQLQARIMPKQGAVSSEQDDPQSALREKESQRWQAGAEMTPDDFARFLTALNRTS